MVKARSQGGFTMVEILVVIVILAIMCAVAIFSIRPALAAAHVETAYTTTISSLDLARARATAMGRVYAVTFTLPGTVTITDAQDATVPPIRVLALPSDVSFDAEAGIPATNSGAPDNIGNGQPDGAICFDIGVTANCSNTVLFYPDGSARDAAGNVNNGVVYLARPGQLQSSRAITLLGLTGRTRGWRLERIGSAGTTYWR